MRRQIKPTTRLLLLAILLLAHARSGHANHNQMPHPDSVRAHRPLNIGRHEARLSKAVRIHGTGPRLDRIHKEIKALHAALEAADEQDVNQAAQNQHLTALVGEAYVLASAFGGLQGIDRETRDTAGQVLALQRRDEHYNPENDPTVLLRAGRVDQIGRAASKLEKAQKRRWLGWISGGGGSKARDRVAATTELVETLSRTQASLRGDAQGIVHDLPKGTDPSDLELEENALVAVAARAGRVLKTELEHRVLREDDPVALPSDTVGQAHDALAIATAGSSLRTDHGVYLERNAPVERHILRLFEDYLADGVGAQPERVASYQALAARYQYATGQIEGDELSDPAEVPAIQAAWQRATNRIEGHLEKSRAAKRGELQHVVAEAIAGRIRPEHVAGELGRVARPATNEDTRSGQAILQQADFHKALEFVWGGFAGLVDGHVPEEQLRELQRHPTLAVELERHARLLGYVVDSEAAVSGAVLEKVESGVARLNERVRQELLQWEPGKDLSHIDQLIETRNEVYATLLGPLGRVDSLPEFDDTKRAPKASKTGFAGWADSVERYLAEESPKWVRGRSFVKRIKARREKRLLLETTVAERLEAHAKRAEQNNPTAFGYSGPNDAFPATDMGLVRAASLLGRAHGGDGTPEREAMARRARQPDIDRFTRELQPQIDALEQDTSEAHRLNGGELVDHFRKGQETLQKIAKTLQRAGASGVQNFELELRQGDATDAIGNVVRAWLSAFVIPDKSDQRYFRLRPHKVADGVYVLVARDPTSGVESVVQRSYLPEHTTVVGQYQARLMALQMQAAQQAAN